MNAPINKDREFKQIMIWGSSLPAGAILAALQALQADYSFKTSLFTFVAFIVGTSIGLIFWKIIFETTRPIWRMIASTVMTFGGIAAFLYPLRFIPVSKLAELMTGLSFAVFALSLAAIMMLKLRDFFDEDDRVNANANAR